LGNAGTACRAPTNSKATEAGRTLRGDGAQPACGRQALRSHTMGFEDESPRKAIHKQRPNLDTIADWMQ